MGGGGGGVTVVLAIFVVGAALLIVEFVARHYHLAPETARKTAHVAAGLIASVLPWTMSLKEIAVVAVAFMPLLLISRRLSLLRSIHAAERTTLGELYFPAGVLFASLAVPAAIDFSFGVLVMTLADAAAGVVGERLGTHNYRLPVAHKTLEGTAAFFIVSIILSLAVLAIGGASWGFVSAVGIAAALTLTESLLGWGLDNAALPVVGAVLMRLALA
jgi:phytol kinase